MIFAKKNKILFKGDFTDCEVVLKEIKSSLVIDKNLEKKCITEWKKMTKEAKDKGMKLWDSKTYRFESLKIKNGKLTIEISTVPYSIRATMRNYPDIIENLGIKYAHLGIFSSCFIKTLDNKYIFIEKSNKYYLPKDRKFSLVGGVLSKSEKIIKSGKDFFSEVSKEIEEETGVPDDHISSFILKSGYITENYHACFIFGIILNIDFNEAKERFYKFNDGEASNIVGIDKKNLQSFILKLPTRDIKKFEIFGLI